MSATPVWLAAVEAMLNRSIAAQAGAMARARRLEGKSLQIDIVGFARVRAGVCGGALVLATGDDSPADAILSGSPSSLLQMMRGGARTAAGSAVQVRGDAESAAAFRELLTLARPDWEEELSRLVGDFAARRIGGAGRRTLAWLRGVGRSSGQNIAEYLQEESRVLVNRTEMEEFLRAVDDLREAGDRAEARLKRLEQRLRAGA